MFCLTSKRRGYIYCLYNSVQRSYPEGKLMNFFRCSCKYARVRKYVSAICYLNYNQMCIANNYINLSKTKNKLLPYFTAVPTGNELLRITIQISNVILSDLNVAKYAKQKIVLFFIIYIFICAK